MPLVWFKMISFLAFSFMLFVVCVAVLAIFEQTKLKLTTSFIDFISTTKLKKQKTTTHESTHYWRRKPRRFYRARFG
jgi:hypothetical protein